ncbi:TetR family transcriptional regulator [Peptidiphaga sp.]|uniref:TetR family transcriptional regulator n=1 Tax=Peptidiphaga sp. TaxID=2848648 RepID=UPI00360933D0
MLFSERGHSAVRIADIAAAVSVKPPSLYKHTKASRPYSRRAQTSSPKGSRTSETP